MLSNQRSQLIDSLYLKAFKFACTFSYAFYVLMPTPVSCIDCFLTLLSKSTSSFRIVSQSIWSAKYRWKMRCKFLHSSKLIGIPFWTDIWFQTPIQNSAFASVQSADFCVSMPTHVLWISCNMIGTCLQTRWSFVVSPLRVLPPAHEFDAVYSTKRRKYSHKKQCAKVRNTGNRLFILHTPSHHKVLRENEEWRGGNQNLNWSLKLVKVCVTV